MERRFARTFGPLKGRYVDEVRRRDLRELLDKVADRGAPREAQQRRQVARVMFRWALSQDLIEIDPTAGLASYGTSPRRDRVLTDEEIKLVWDWLSTGAVPEGYAEALKLQLATGARIGEVAGMQVAEVDLTTWLWTLPENRSKNGRARVTPLVGLAREIVAARCQTSSDGPLFWSERGLRLDSNLVASMLVKHRKEVPIEHFTSHDLRRTVATGLVDLGIPYELVAAVIGHEVGAREVKTLIRHYVRTDLLERKSNALLAWDAKLRQIASGLEVPGNVAYLPKVVSKA
jgi:integrase